MKKILILFFALVLVTMAFADSVVIGTGTDLYRFPLGSWFGFERSAALYTDAELGTQNTRISAISWYSNTAISVAVPTKIYLKTTGNNAIVSDTWANMIAGATLVYDATHTGTLAGAWNSFTLSSSFDVDEGNGVIIMVERNYGGNGNGTSLGAGINSSPATDTHLTWVEDGSAPTHAGYHSSFRPNVTLTYTSVSSSLDCRIKTFQLNT